MFTEIAPRILEDTDRGVTETSELAVNLETDEKIKKLHEEIKHLKNQLGSVDTALEMHILREENR